MGNYNVGLLTKEKLINSAKKLFYEFGYNKTTIKAICENADILRTGFVYYFKDKAAIADYISNYVNTQIFVEIQNELNARDQKLDALLLFVYSSSLFFLSIMSDPHLNLFYSEVLTNNADMLLGDKFYRTLFQSMYTACGKDINSKDFELFFIYNTSSPGVFLKRYLKGSVYLTKKEIVTYFNREIMRGLSIKTAEQNKILTEAEKLRNEIEIDLKDLFLRPYEHSENNKGDL